MFGYNKKYNYITVVFLAVILLGVLIYLFYLSRNFDRLKQDFLTMSLHQAHTAIENDLREKIEMIGLLADMYKNYTPEENQEILKQVANIGDFKRILYTGFDGIAISNLNEHIEYTDKNYFLELVNDDINIVGPFVSDLDGEITVAIVAPVLDENNQIKFALLSSMRVIRIFHALEDLYLRNGSRSYLLANDGSHILSKFHQDIDTLPEQYTDEHFVLGAFENIEFDENNIAFAQYNNNGSIVYVGYMPIENMNSVLAVAIQRDEVFNTMDNMVNINILAIVLLTVILFIFIMYAKELNIKILSQREKIKLTTEIADLLTFEINNNGDIINANDRITTVLGYTKDEMLKINIKDLFFDISNSENAIKLDYSICGAELADNATLTDNAIITKHGGLMYVLWKIVKTPLETVEYLGTDISELKESQHRVEYIMYHDTLTGLQNKIKLEEYVNDILKKGSDQFAFLHLDLDNFKHINDTFGYILGDKVLIEMTDRINTIYDAYSMDKVNIFRVSGDEFVIIYKGYDNVSDIGDLANLVMNTISREYYYDSYNFIITASIGISCYPEDAKDYSELYKTAEIAMSNAKELGKHRVSFFNEYMKKELEFMVFALHDMKMAFENEEYLLYYQPQYDIASGELRGFESLMRWISPVRGFVSPGQFIPYAEKSGMIKLLGKWALEEACRFAKKIRDLGYEDITVGINVSTVQVLDDNFVNDVLDIISKTGVDVRDIYLELTESILLDTTDVNSSKIKHLNEAGIVFALDDFGTGYSSLTYLKKLPFSMLKLDKTFIDSISSDKEHDKDTRKIVEAMLDLSHNINLEVVAEGVEKEDQLMWLKERNCDMCQGYFTGRPLPETDALACLGNNIYNKS